MNSSQSPQDTKGNFVCLAVWAATEPGEGPVCQWDAEKMTVTNIEIEEMQSLIKPTYPKGYTLDA